MNIITRFELGNAVKLPNSVHNNMNGRILAFWIDRAGIQYKVRYFWESKPQEVYFHEEELEEKGI